MCAADAVEQAGADVPDSCAKEELERACSVRHQRTGDAEMLRLRICMTVVVGTSGLGVRERGEYPGREKTMQPPLEKIGNKAHLKVSGGT